MDSPAFPHDIDRADTFSVCESKLSACDVSNFAVQFNSEQARCATDLTQATLTPILDRRKHDSSQSSLWLNFWGWAPEHYEMVTAISRHYHVSPRLAQMLCPKVSGNICQPLKTSPRAHHSELHRSGDDSLKKESTSSASPDVEARAETKLVAPTKSLTSVADVANDLWHFCTVDFGAQYICVGWNALFFAPEGSIAVADSKPNAIRIWSSLLLCSDGTIVSVFESPQDLSPPFLKKVRSNQLNIFRHLSRHYLQHITSNALMQVTLRSHPHDPSGNTRSPFDMASLLLYYLFDDWLNIYAQVSGGSDSYRQRLEHLRGQMTQAPDIEQVKDLHRIGRQLSALKSIYKSYEAIIERLVQHHRRMMSLDHLTHMKDSARGDGGFSEPLPPIAAGSASELKSTSVRLTASSVARFERLFDRLEICALTEVEECLKEKEALVLMNFNLVSLKESQAVEKLTRTTILLAKVTILFLPVSLVTAYFSMQFKVIDQMYSLETFWLTALVVAVLTAVALLAYGVFSERVMGRVTYKSFTQLWYDRQKRLCSS